jgi:lipid-binding SYLF domain-containing protein
MIKGGFFLGGSRGKGVLLLRNEKSGTWCVFGFYTLGSVKKAPVAAAKGT